MAKYQDFIGMLIYKKRNVFGKHFLFLKNDIESITVEVGKQLYEIYSDGAQLQVGHIGKN